MIFQQMQQEALPLLNKIYNLPFNRELMAGVLPKDIFNFYLKQDSLYLVQYAKALALTAARLPHNHLTEQFLQFALEAINEEKSLHQKCLVKGSAVGSSISLSPTCFMYTNYLLNMATVASVEEAVASLLPCFWVYQQVANYMVRHMAELDAHPYQDWLMVYSSAEFAQSVLAAIAITDEVASQASSAIQNKMLAAFHYATKLEWMFWDSAYQQEVWKV